MGYTQNTYVPKQTNHLLHLVLSLATCGFWLPVWACVAVYNAMTKVKVATQGAWYGPVARPYEVGPGAPVSAMNPHPPTRPVATPLLRPEGTTVWWPPSYVGYRPGYPNNMTTPPPVSNGDAEYRQWCIDSGQDPHPRPPSAQ